MMKIKLYCQAHIALEINQTLPKISVVSIGHKTAITKHQQILHQVDSSTQNGQAQVAGTKLMLVNCQMAIS